MTKGATSQGQPNVTTSLGSTNGDSLHLDLLIKLKDPKSTGLIASLSEAIAEGALKGK